MFFFQRLRILGAIAIAVRNVDALANITEIYDGGYGINNSDVALRIATGGAGQSGLVGALANAFIKAEVQAGSQPFTVGWVLSDTTFTIKNLQTGDADLGISYVPDAEILAAEQGIIDPNRYYLFRDHFQITGPLENPAGINDTMDVRTIFAKIYEAGELNTNATEIQTKFLSRNDKSATNHKEADLWLKIGQVPWALPLSPWYDQYRAFPIDALNRTVVGKEYTLTDKSTYYSLLQQDQNAAARLNIFKQGTDDENDPLLLPGHLLVGLKAGDLAFAHKFAVWATSPAGQSVVTGFEKYGVKLYSGAPPL